MVVGLWRKCVMYVYTGKAKAGLAEYRWWQALAGGRCPNGEFLQGGQLMHAIIEQLEMELVFFLLRRDRDWIRCGCVGVQPSFKLCDGGISIFVCD